MEVKTDYKETQYGPLAADWPLVPLWKFSSFITKGSTPTTYGYDWQSDGVRFLRSECVAEHGLDLKESMFISKEAHSMLDRSEVRSGDLLMTITGNVGRAVLLDEDFGTGNINQHIARIRITDSRLDKRFALHFLSQRRVREYYESITTGQAYPQISLKQVRETEIPLPPLPEQRAIADALSDVDALIERLDALIAKKRAIKTATMQRLLTGQQRLPGFDGEWTTKRLGDVFALLQTANNSRKDLSDHGDVAYIHYGDIHTFTKSHLDLQRDHLPFIDASKMHNATPLQNGDLVMVDASEDYEGVGKSIEVSGLNGHPAIAGLHTFLLRGDDAYVADGFKGYMQHMPNLIEALHRIATGTSVYGISKTKIKDIDLRLPPVEEQEAIATILSDMDAEIEALQARREKTQAIKQGMMQELLTGRTRLV